jgi:hypothetical protein
VPNSIRRSNQPSIVGCLVNEIGKVADYRIQQMKLAAVEQLSHLSQQIGWRYRLVDEDGMGSRKVFSGKDIF